MSLENDRGEEAMEFEYKKVDRQSDRADGGIEDAANAEAAESDDAGAQDEEAALDAGAEQLNIDIYQILRLMVGMVGEQAWIGLGLHPRAGSTELETRLSEARICIDTLKFIREQLEGNLQETEKRELDNLVSTLQMNYIRRA